MSCFVQVLHSVPLPTSVPVVLTGQLKPENFLENRLSYSAFKHMNAFQVLLGEAFGRDCSVLG